MDRLIAQNSVAIGGADTAPVSGTPQYATSGNPLTDTPATQFPAYQYNAMQEELIAIIAAAGITPDRTNNAQVAAAIKALIESLAGNYALDTGAANAYVIALTPPVASYTDGMGVRFLAVHANTGASTLNAGGGAVALVRDDEAALQAGDIAAHSMVSATYVLSLNSFLINSVVLSQFLVSPAFSGTPTAPTPAQSDSSTKVATTAFAQGLITGGMAKNMAYNGSCRVLAGATVNISSSPQYGKVDTWAGWATGTAVSAGTVTQDAAASIGTYGKALHLSGVTVTGSGVVLARQRIPAADAVLYKNKVCTFSAVVHQDTGGSINYTMVIRKPNGADNYSGVTAIGTSSAQGVPTASGTRITFPNVSMGDCSAGIELEIQGACGAVTTKNFRFSDMQLEEGIQATEFEQQHILFERTRCGYLYEKSYDQGTDPATATRVGLVNFGQAASGSNTQNGVGWNFRYSKRAAPTMSYWDGAGTASKFSRRSNSTWTDGSGSFSPIATGENGVLFDSGDTSASAGFIHFAADARL